MTLKPNEARFEIKRENGKKVAIVQDGLTGMMIKFILEEKDGDKNGMECNGCVEPEHTGSIH